MRYIAASASVRPVCPQGKISIFSPSHTPHGVFSLFTRKRTFAFSLAPTDAFSSVSAPTRQGRVRYSEPAPAGDSQ